MKRRIVRKVLVVTLLLIMLVPILIQPIAASEPSYTGIDVPDALFPVNCSRLVLGNGLEVSIVLENTLSVDLNATGILYAPEGFGLVGEENMTSKWKSPVNQTHTETVNMTPAIPLSGSFTVHWGLIPARTIVTELDPFKIPINGSLAVPDHFMLNLTYSEFEGLLSEREVIVHTFEVVPVEWLEGGDRAAIEITDWYLSDNSLYKGQSLNFIFEVHSNHHEPLQVYLNTKIRELTKIFIGFHEGVWAFLNYGKDTGVWLYPDQTIYIELNAGPFLHDSARGYWALNGALGLTGMPNQPPTIVPVDYQVSHMQAYGWNGWNQGYYSPTITGPNFNVRQNPSEHQILVAVVDDTWTSFVATTLLSNAVHHTFRVGRGMNLGSPTNFVDEFNMDFHFLHVGSYQWDSRLYSNVDRKSALEATIHQLGQSLKLGGAWVGAEHVINPNDPNYSQGYTMRENHGFDIGFGVMCGGYWTHSGEGLAWQLASSCMVLSSYFNPAANPSRIEEVAVHELAHLFGAIHGEDSTPQFGPQFDGYNYIMESPSGWDIWAWSTEWRMHDTTRDRIIDYYHSCKFDGAPIPEYSGGKWYGQIRSYAYLTQPGWSPVYYRDKTGSYYWNYDTSHYDYFTVTTETKGFYEEWARLRLAQRVQGNIVWSKGKTNFHVGYEFNWGSSYWPDGFSPSSTTVWLYFEGLIWQSDTAGGASSVDNVRMHVFGDKSASPVQYYVDSFKASAPGGKWERCDSRWGGGARGHIVVNDVSTWIAFGFRDAWSANWHQQIYMHFGRAVYYFSYTDWQ